ncbi:hypothetical protein HS5_20540 [Acidianus sp. HS-5]|nr:hypothetical protein HS5_20540 [Acidianus sp. HS-5]
MPKIVRGNNSLFGPTPKNIGKGPISINPPTAVLEELGVETVLDKAEMKSNAKPINIKIIPTPMTDNFIILFMILRFITVLIIVLRQHYNCIIFR